MKSADQIAREVDAGRMMLRNQWIWICLLSGFLSLSILTNLVLFYNAFYRFPIKQFILCRAVTKPSTGASAAC